MRPFLLFLFLSLMLNLSAQDYHFKQISLAEGLSQSSINAIAQDANGFLWLATQDGLNQFDGNTFNIYKNIPFDSSSLAENFITALSVDNKNKLWVGTMNEGVHLFHPENGTFSRFHHDKDNTESLSSNNITKIYTDKNGRVWVGTTNGLNLIQIKKNKISFKRFQYNPTLARSFPDINYVRDLLVDSQNNLWLGTVKGLFKFEIKTTSKGIELAQKKHWQNDNTDNKTPTKKITNNIAHNNIQTIEEDALGRIWIGSVKALQIVGDKSFETVQLFDDNRYGSINDLHVDSKGQLLVGTHHGIFILKYDNNRYQKPILFEHSTNGMNSLHDNMIFHIFEDNHHDGLYWLGTYLSGIGQMYKRKKRFVTNYMNATEIGKNISSSVHLITKQKNDVLWLNTNSGLLRFDRKINNYQLIEKLPIIGQKETYHPNRSTAIFKDSKEQIWLGSRMGLLKLVKQGKNYAVKLFQTAEEEAQDIFEIYENDEKLYLGSWTGINVLDLKTETLAQKSVVIDSIGSTQYGYEVRDLLKDKNNNWWVGTTHGVVLFRNVIGDFWEHLRQHKGEVFKHNPSNKKSLISERITVICEDENSGIWLGTHSALVKIIDKKGKIEFQSFGEQDGLANGLVYTVANDKNHLWLSTNHGLSRFHINNETFKNFSIKDGLQSNEFNGKSFFQAEDGELLFGGINGFTSFHPNEINMETKPPTVLLTTLETRDNQYNLLNKESIRLKYTQNSFSVQFIGLDLLYPTDVEYFYRLEGKAADDMISLGNSRQVNFTQLGAGGYTLQILAKNKDGVMNVVGDTIEIIIEAPFWQSWWFFLIVLALISFLFWAVYHIRYLDKMQKLAEIERVRKNAAQDFHDELGSKLTVITMFTELTKSRLNGQYHEVAPYLDKVSDTAGSLYHSMKDLIWALNPEQDTVHDLFLQMKDFGDELFDQTGVEFKSEGIETAFQTQQIPMEYKRHILLIFKELMNNALKHSDCTAVDLMIKNEDNYIQIALKDNGVGFNSMDEYDGDGLKNIYSRADKIGGKIKVCSTNRGTSVTLSVPQLLEITG